MPNDNDIKPGYFREFRRVLGFTNQQELKDFFRAKDIVPAVDFVFMDSLNKRLVEIVHKVDSVVHESVRQDDLRSFVEEKILVPFEIMKKNGIFTALNNQGRRPEHVYYNWMRGHVISSYFINALARIFGVKTEAIELIGDDDLRNPDTFKRTPKADLEIPLDGKRPIRIEMQAGFTGTNDIKQHKVIEAKRISREQDKGTLAIHFDLYNGQAAFLRLDAIQDDDVNWITRQQLEGQTVFNIEQNHFLWKLTEAPPEYSALDLA